VYIRTIRVICGQQFSARLKGNPEIGIRAVRDDCGSPDPVRSAAFVSNATRNKRRPLPTRPELASLEFLLFVRKQLQRPEIQEMSSV
jgi:hypothetical protein